MLIAFYRIFKFKFTSKVKDIPRNNFQSLIHFPRSKITWLHWCAWAVYISLNSTRHIYQVGQPQAAIEAKWRILLRRRGIPDGLLGNSIRSAYSLGLCLWPQYPAHKLMACLPMCLQTADIARWAPDSELQAPLWSLHTQTNYICLTRSPVWIISKREDPGVSFMSKSTKPYLELPLHKIPWERHSTWPLVKALKMFLEFLYKANVAKLPKARAVCLKSRRIYCALLRVSHRVGKRQIQKINVGGWRSRRFLQEESGSPPQQPMILCVQSRLNERLARWAATGRLGSPESFYKCTGPPLAD